MKKLFLAAVLAATSTAWAGPWHHHGYPHRVYYPDYGWVVPAVIGGAIVYGATRPNPPPPPPTVIYVPQGYPPAPVGYHYEQLLDANCNCYRWVLIQG